MNWNDILQNTVQTVLTVIITFLIFYFAGILKKRFGQSLAEKYLRAASIAVKIAEQLSLRENGNLNGIEKKKTATEIAHIILKKENEKNIDDDLLDKTIEASVYEIGRRR